MDYDVAIIGAGVIGLACAMRLSEKGLSVVVLERHARFGQETSSRNSGVLHAGFYTVHGSLKANLCARGNRQLQVWCLDHDVAFAKIGKYVVATDEPGEAVLETLFRQGLENDVSDLRLVSGIEVSRAEPWVSAQAGLWSGTSAIVDVGALMTSFYTSCAPQTDFAFLSKVYGVERVTGGYILEVQTVPTGDCTSVAARRVVNAAGLDADNVAARLDLPVERLGWRQHWVRGRYFNVNRKEAVRSLVYPVPPVDSVGLGVHLTPDMDGRLRLGPDTDSTDLRDAYAIRVQDYRVEEEAVSSFLLAGQRFLPNLRREHLSPDTAGIRPTLVGRDFVIESATKHGFENWINLIGIDSPGLTCCLPIADRVVELFGV